ncbi:MAG: hypothetical protein J1F03_04075 [Oscillospiraceae bacterium]|nr:hypothetical protein [Oscillospiraceae bacterium]
MAFPGTVAAAVVYVNSAGLRRINDGLVISAIQAVIRAVWRHGCCVQAHGLGRVKKPIERVI